MKAIPSINNRFTTAMAWFSVVFLTLILGGCDPSDSGTGATDNVTEASAPGIPTPSPQATLETELPSALETGPMESDWSLYIANHSSGWQPAKAPINIEFSQAFFTTDGPLSTALKDAITIQPEIEFELKATSTKSLELTPSRPLSSGTHYTVTVSASGFETLPDSLGNYPFQIQALQQDIELQVAGLMPAKDRDHMQLTGEIQTNDSADNDAVEQIIKVLQNNAELPVLWRHDPDNNRHHFTVTDIFRDSATSEITMIWDADALGVDKRGQRQFKVPAIDQFAVTAVRSRHNPEQYIDVTFSEPLDRNQNLAGLVTLNGQAPRLRIDGSHLRVYPSQQKSGELTLEIHDTIRSSKQLNLAAPYSQSVIFISELPGVRYTGNGAILPPEKNLHVPFEAINVNAVWVTAFKTFDHNIPSYLRHESLSGNDVHRDYGRYLWKKKISLPDIPRDTWQRFHLELDELMAQHPDGLINIRLSIDPSVSVFPCDAPPVLDANSNFTNYEGPGNDAEEDHPDWYYRYYNVDNGYLSWSQRQNPCHASFYNYNDQASAQRNFLISNIGLIAKRGRDQQLNIVTTDLLSSAPLGNARIEVYNYQHERVASGTTDAKGMLSITPKSKPFYLIARHKSDTGYLKIADNQALPVSQFDTGGSTIKRGIKGFLYGERDVWRPGDDIHVTFILSDPENRIPDQHPVSLDLFDPRDVKVSSQSNNTPVGNLYTFTLKTREDAPTGTWRAVARVGGDYFDLPLKIETIKPNRLKVTLNIGDSKTIQTGLEPLRAELHAQWLNGATAKNLKADTELKLRPTKTRFDGFSQYHFDDPASDFENEAETVFEGKLDRFGNAAFNLNLRHLSAPGKLRATFVNRVFENSGEFSKTIQTMEILPFQHWVGLNIPKGSGYRGAIGRDQDHTITLQSIDSDSTPLADRDLTLSVYRLDWRWWWDQSQDNLAHYVNSQHNQRLEEVTLTTDTHGRAQWQLKGDRYDWGRHLIRVCDNRSGHCSGQEVYLGWSWDNQINPDAATQLMLSTDKKHYKVGDTAVINIPELAEGQLLYSLENGTSILEQKWLSLDPGARSFEIPVTAAMAPNAYVSLSLLLPHQNRESDAPIRLYGVVPLLVENPDSHLKPTITAPASVRPQKRFTVNISEQNGRSMNYTLAMVDEGLLGITNYSTPNPHGTFYKKEALGVYTWDMYDSVAGAYGASLERLLRIGGGDNNGDKDGAKRRRFPPVVQFVGAFQLAAGETREHTIELPQYMGAVRLMVIAADDSEDTEGAYGRAEHSMTVTQPLTLLATLPRVLGPGETLGLPVNVFSNTPDIQKVSIRAKADDMFNLPVNEATLTFNEPGDQIATLQLAVGDRLGRGAITVSAEATYEDADGNTVTEKAEQTIHIESRAPNPPSSKQQSRLLQPGEIWAPDLKPHGIAGTNSSTVAISSMPPLNLEKRLDYLIRYPHGCLEQTTSAAFPQITLHQLMPLSDSQSQAIQKHVDAAVNKLQRFQTSEGNFSYWPGQSYQNNWASVYATHFLIVAADQGYAIPQNLLRKATTYLRENISSDSDEVTGYQLYVLSLSGQPELAAMNRLREQLLKKTTQQQVLSRWQLALAYKNVGLPDIARELLAGVVDSSATIDHRTYGSPLRNNAIRLMTQSISNDPELSWHMASAIAKQLSGDQWHSTQSTAWALMAMADYSLRSSAGDSNQFAITEQNSATPVWQSAESLQTYFSQSLESQTLSHGKLQIRNDSQHPLYAQVSNTGTPTEGDEREISQGLVLDIRYEDLSGNPIDINALPQGQDVRARVRVALPENAPRRILTEDIALTMVMPSGWEIRNQRLEGESFTGKLDYQDIRDDRIYSYFSLWRNQSWGYYDDRYYDRNRREVEIEVLFNASYAGRFYLPAWEVKAMYDENTVARTTGQWVEVVPEPQP